MITHMSGAKTTTLIGIAIVLIIIGALLLSFSTNRERDQLLAINNFDDCKAAGYPIMESYPEQCATPDGRSFVNEAQREPQNSTSTQIVVNGCAVAGCSGQLCVSAGEASGILTTCEFKTEYACYREASCEPQANGKCGWTQTTELKQCIAEAKSAPPMEAVY